MSNLTNITTAVAAMQDNELETMSIELQQLRNENDALKLENQRLKTQLDDKTSLLVSKTREVEKLRSELESFNGIQDASTVCIYNFEQLNLYTCFNMLTASKRHTTSSLR